MTHTPFDDSVPLRVASCRKKGRSDPTRHGIIKGGTWPFGGTYAGVYDAVHTDKDYESECDVIERLIAARLGRLAAILDLGCGTGGHAIPLARRGHRVTGVDRAPKMISIARDKADGEVEFVVGDIRELALDRRFDVVLMMFTVLGYQLKDADVQETLRVARNHLAAGGLLIFDIWYGPAVENTEPSTTSKHVATAQGRLIRSAQGVLDARRHRCMVTITLTRENGGRTELLGTERHPIRYFFADELEAFLCFAGFSDFELSAFPDIDRPAGEDSWTVLGVARAS